MEELINIFEKDKKLTFRQQIKKIWKSQNIVNKVITIVLLAILIFSLVFRVF